jgi:hypothetical protein
VETKTGGRFEAKMETMDDWQNLSTTLSESVILEEMALGTQVTISHKVAENTDFRS